MSFIVEDGTAVANANAYLPVAAADDYFATHSKSAAWAALGTAAKQTAIVQATRAIDGLLVWKGYKNSLLQARQWPRTRVMIEGPYTAAFFTGIPGEYPTNVVPQEVKDAVCEVAALFLDGDRTADADGAGIKMLNLGSGALEIEFDQTSRPEILGRIAPSLLSQFITGGTSGPRMVRIRRQ